MRFFFALAVVVFGAVSVPMNVATASEADASFAFAPHLASDADETLSGTMWSLTESDCTIRLQRIGERDRQTYIKRVTGSDTDPFASRPDQRPGYVTFLAEIENQGDTNMVVQPSNWWLVTNKKEVINPIGIEDLMATFEMMGEKMAPAYELARPAILSTTQFLGPGESASGLLIYRIFDAKTKNFNVDAILTSPKGDLVTLRAAYRRVKKEKKKP